MIYFIIMARLLYRCIVLVVGCMPFPYILLITLYVITVICLHYIYIYIYIHTYIYVCVFVCVCVCARARARYLYQYSVYCRQPFCLCCCLFMSFCLRCVNMPCFWFASIVFCLSVICYLLSQTEYSQSELCPRQCIRPPTCGLCACGELLQIIDFHLSVVSPAIT